MFKIMARHETLIVITKTVWKDSFTDPLHMEKAVACLSIAKTIVELQ
jgi:hypothetical protein